MKRLLLVLLVLGLSVPAIADVFIYNLKQSGVEFQDEEGNWTQSKVSDTTYFVIEVDMDGPSLVSLWSVDTWKASGKNYYDVNEQDVSNFELLPAQNGKKWIILYASDTEHGLLTGQVQSTKIGNQKLNIATKLTGYFIWHDVTGGDIGAGTMSLQLNVTMTKNWHALSSAEAKDALVVYLVSKGYIEGD
jgi:hypothetical protein